MINEILFVVEVDGCGRSVTARGRNKQLAKGDAKPNHVSGAADYNASGMSNEGTRGINAEACDDCNY